MVIFYPLVFGSVCRAVEGVEPLLLVATAARGWCVFSSDCTQAGDHNPPACPVSSAGPAGAAAGP